MIRLGTVLSQCKIVKSDIRINNLLKCSFSTHNHPHFDIIIIGGGMVGTTMACSLAKNPKLTNKQILLLERRPEVKWEMKEKFSKRVSALNIHTSKILKTLGIWDHICDNRFTCVKRLQVWDACSDTIITFNHNDMANNNIAYIVENQLIIESAKRIMSNLNNVELKYQSNVKKYELCPENIDEKVTVHLEDGSAYTCNLLIAADGPQSKVRQTAGFHYLSWDYNQMAVVATVQLSEPTENVVAWQRFLPTGPVALLPLNNNLSSLVWTTTTNKAKKIIKLPNDQFVDAINEALWKEYPRDTIVDNVTDRLNNLLTSLSLSSNAVRQLQPSVSDVVEGSRAGFPLVFGHASNYVTKRIALVGDAAHAIHPLAGQGVNLGFGDVACLSDVLGNAVYRGVEIGDLSSLKEYEKLRQLHNIPTVLAIEGLQKLYGTTFTPLVVLRSVGLQLTNSLQPVKDAIMKQAAF